MAQVPPYALGYNPYAAAAVAPIPYAMPLGGYSPTLATYPGMAGAGGYPSTATLTTNPVGGYDPGDGGTGLRRLWRRPLRRLRHRRPNGWLPARHGRRY